MAVAQLTGQGVPVWIEPSAKRIFSDQAYLTAGAQTLVSANQADVVLGIKEPEIDKIQPGQVHVAFSHTIKGQAYNMDLLQRFIDQGATLIDYEPMKDEDGQRIIAFGRYAGIAGAAETLSVAGQKLGSKGVATKLSGLGRTYEYGTVAKLKAAVEALGAGPDEDLRVAVVGTGKVGRGSAEVCRWLGLPRIEAEQLASAEAAPGFWHCVLGTEDIVAAMNGGAYNKCEYREFGVERYRSVFVERYLGKFNILLQTPYWEEKYPRQLSFEDLSEHRDKLPLAIGDISCDIEGSLACTLRETTIDEPAFTFIPGERRARPGISWDGPTVMAIDHLPCELSEDASFDFSDVLVELMPSIVRMELNKSLEKSGLSPVLQRAAIVYRGELTPSFAHLERFLHQPRS